MNSSNGHKKPLELVQCAMISVMIAAQIKKNEIVHSLRERCILPQRLVVKMLLMIEIGSNSPTPYRHIRRKTVVEDMLRTSLNIPNEIRNFQEKEFKKLDPECVQRLIMEFQDYLRLPTCYLIRNVPNIMLNHDGLIEFLLQRITNLVIINNMLILSVAYQRVKILKLCIKYGAYDFVSGFLMATLVDPKGEMIEILKDPVRTERSLVLQRAEQHLFSYYYNGIDMARHSSPYLRYLAGDWLENRFRYGTPLKDISESVEDIFTCMVEWSDDNIFKSLNYISVHSLSQLGLKYRDEIEECRLENNLPVSYTD